MSKNYTIYVDGSDLKHTTHRMGIGAILLGDTGQELGRLGKELSPEFLMSEYGTTDCSNPTAESIAVVEALTEWSEIFRAGDKVTICQDYIGPAEWSTGHWRINKDYIRRAIDRIHGIIEDTGITIQWHWVKGHQKGTLIYGSEAYWNDQVDKLAKGKNV